jgi:hypothetical protein
MSGPALHLRDIVSTAFVLVRAAGPADRAFTAVTAAGTAATEVIVDGGAPGRWFLVSVREASDLLVTAASSVTVDAALDLARRPVVPVADGGMPIGATWVPGGTIVVEGGRVLGFVPVARMGAMTPLGTDAPDSPAPSAGHAARAEPPDRGARAEPPEPPARGARAEPPEPPDRSPAAPVRRGGVLEVLEAEEAAAAGGAASAPRRAASPGATAVPAGPSTPGAAPTAAGPAQAGGGGSAATPQPVRSLEADFPDRVPLGSVAWLLVSITQQAATSHGIGLHVAAGESIDIVVQPRAGFALDGTDRGTLEVPASGESLPFQFKLKATEEGTGTIRVLAFHAGEPLGAITLTPVVEPVTASPPAAGRTAPRASAALASPSPLSPDLTLFVEEWTTDATRRYRILLSASDPALQLNLETFGPYPLQLDPGAFFSTFFSEIDALPLDTPAQRDAADRKLAQKGAYLADALLPEDLRERLWAVRDRIGSVVVQSEEPWIPWELCKLTGRDGDRVVEGPFLCEAYAITRWLPGTGFKRPLRITKLALVVPADSTLPLAPAERDYVLSLATATREVTSVAATYASVQDAFKAGLYDAWHFTGHGGARDGDADTSAIVLAGGDLLTPESISGAAANVGVPHPLVFFNACQVGRSGMALTGIGGWASRFVQAGAGAFIGAYWSVIDEPAFDFAKAVYGRLLAGAPIGEAVRDARNAIRTPGDPTWLAYTVFADPLAVIEGGDA